jgi:flagellar biosynthesis protein FliQ
MGPDQVSELMRHLMLECLILSIPILITAMGAGFLLSLFQTLTSLQEQTFTVVPRLLLVAVVMMVGMPWYLHRLISYTTVLFSDFHRYLG